MKISLCMIVKNEEDMLLQSLTKVSQYVEEMIVVDTGSTDRSKEIALSCSAKVYDFPWRDDFSAARNFALEKASCEWVLVIDADEIIIDFKIDDIQRVLKADYLMVGRIKLINIVADATGEKRYNERVSRLFNRRHFHYEGIIHEQIVRKDGNPYKTIPIQVTAEHRGYTQEVIRRTDKIKRNISLLEQALLKSPNDIYLLYQLGKANYMAKNYTEAVNYFEQAIALPLDFSLEYVYNLLETYGYALINCERYAETMGLINYEMYYADSTDYRFLMGHVYMNNGKFPQAIECFLRCVDHKEGKLEGINSYLPMYNIAVIYECLGYRAEAVSYYQKCGNYHLAFKRLTEIL